MNKGLALVAAFAVAAWSGCGGGNGSSALPRGGGTQAAAQGAARHVRGTTGGFTVVQSSANLDTTPPRTTLYWAQPPAARNVLIAVVRWNRSGSVTSSGWTLLDSTSSQVVNGFVFFKIAGPSEPATVTFTASSSGGYPSVTGVEIAGANAAAPIDRHAIAAVGSGPSFTTPSLAPSVEGTLPLAVVDTGGAGRTFVTPSGWTNLYAEPGGVTGAFVRNAVTGGTTAVGVTVSASGTPAGYSTFTWEALLAPAPTTGSGACAGLTNASPFPATCQFYSAASPWRTTLAAAPRQLANSTAIVQHYMAITTQYLAIAKFNSPNDGSVDYSLPYYVAGPGDPRVTLACASGGYCGNLAGRTVRIPAGAKPEQGGYPGGDQHLIVLDASGAQPVEWDFYGDRNARPLRDGQTFTVVGATTGDPYNGDGWQSADVQGGVAFAAGNLHLGGIVRASEIAAGLHGIGHAIVLTPPCQLAGAAVYPARANATQSCPAGDADTNTAPIGTRWWWDESCDTVAARAGLDAGSKALLCALHTYGGFETDTNGNSSSFDAGVAPESATRYLSLGNPDAADSAVQTYGTNLGYPCGINGGSCYGFNLGGVLTSSDIVTHLHALDACVTRQSC